MNPEPGDLSIQAVAPLPEDSKQTDSKHIVDSDVTFITLISKWQPMGFRIVINLPFVSDDYQPLVAVRVTPYIPHVIQDLIGNGSATAFVLDGSLASPVYPNPGTTASTSTAVTVTRYDLPPPLGVAAAMHRFWRGSMMYRFRCVSNFAAQGYVIATLVRGLVATEVNSVTSSAYNGSNLMNTHRPIQGMDVGTRRSMCNSYIMSDISMFRHIEIEAPFEYPVPFFDTYWNNREQIEQMLGQVPEIHCPDNFVTLFNRGGITGSADGAQVVYELEYAPGPDFEFTTEMPFGLPYLEQNNFNVTNDMLTVLPTLALPMTYPAYTRVAEVDSSDEEEAVVPEVTVTLPPVAQTRNKSMS